MNKLITGTKAVIRKEIEARGIKTMQVEIQGETRDLVVLIGEEHTKDSAGRLVERYRLAGGEICLGAIIDKETTEAIHTTETMVVKLAKEGGNLDETEKPIVYLADSEGGKAYLRGTIYELDLVGSANNAEKRKEMETSKEEEKEYLGEYVKQLGVDLSEVSKECVSLRKIVEGLEQVIKAEGVLRNACYTMGGKLETNLDIEALRQQLEEKREETERKKQVEALTNSTYTRMKNALEKGEIARAKTIMETGMQERGEIEGKQEQTAEPQEKKQDMPESIKRAILEMEKITGLSLMGEGKTETAPDKEKQKKEGVQTIEQFVQAILKD